ncbi:hypothetical protein NPIL_671271 [Nephila pilipes]|uniref:Uncharacterized protein n=1 Tax=Nephila pilipes TaxID=299642 RepID=A0A8X6Q761_NEPPI|nr:hypothetical protein NPIL_671271 [Nephila pilipes]
MSTLVARDPSSLQRKGSEREGEISELRSVGSRRVHLEAKAVIKTRTGAEAYEKESPAHRFSAKCTHNFPHPGRP